MELYGGTMSGAPNPGSISTKLEQIAKRAKEMPGVSFNTLAHHIDIEWLREAYQRTRKDGAVGVDGQTAGEYAAKLEENLRSLLDGAKSGDGYRAPPVRRVHIPKGDGSKTRPIGIPTFEDKVLQRAVVMVLEAVYEQDFYDCSYGFRPGRSAHDALRALREPLMEMNGGWVLEADIEKFFDSVDRAQLQEILRRRVRDGVLHRLIGKWLNAGVMEEGRVYRPESGTPQGGVISPLLANIYLHEVLDEWFAREVKPRLRGRAHLVRYADDFVIAFEQEEDAEAIRQVRSAPPSRENPIGPIQPSESQRPAEGRRGRAGELRPAGFHALLASVAAGQLGGVSQDGGVPSQPGAPSDLALAAPEPTRTDRRAASRAGAEAARPLQLLRHHRELRGSGLVPELCPRAVVQVGVAAFQSRPRTNCDGRVPGCIPASTAAHHARSLSQRSEPMT
jgi:retron-type reverse transcriptase